MISPALSHRPITLTISATAVGMGDGIPIVQQLDMGEWYRLIGCAIERYQVEDVPGWVELRLYVA